MCSIFPALHSAYTDSVPDTDGQEIIQQYSTSRVPTGSSEYRRVESVEETKTFFFNFGRFRLFRLGPFSRCTLESTRNCIQLGDDDEYDSIET